MKFASDSATHSPSALTRSMAPPKRVRVYPGHDHTTILARFASADELVSLCEILRTYPGAQLEFIPTNGPFEELHIDVMARMALAAGTDPRPRFADEGRGSASVMPERLRRTTGTLATSEAPGTVKPLSKEGMDICL